MALLRLLGQLVNLAAGFFTRSALRDLNRLTVLYAGMDDTQLRAELNRAYARGAETAAKPLRLLSKYRDSPILHALAVGTCLFDRHPCDLPPGSHAYDEQKLAALMLIDGINVQMDTGEGKTYAIALAAAGMLAVHPQVLVITANAYLADRDHGRVSGYFHAAGIQCVRGVPAPDFRGIAYTTMGGVCFGYLNRSYRDSRSPLPDYPDKAAIIIDEIDSVLLDQTLMHTTVRILPSDEELWERVFRLTHTWDETRYTHDPVSDVFSLTADAWEEIAQLSTETGKPTSLLITMASGALWARHAESGRHYVQDGEAIHLINQVTGQPFDEGSTRQNALEYLIAGRNPPVSLRVAEIDGLTLLRRHPQVVGLSGTARDDTLFYLQQLGSLTGGVPPRFARYKGKVDSLVAVTREATFNYVRERISDVAPRPVVIGTWSPADAREIADRLVREQVVDQEHLGVITTFGVQTDAAVLDAAGEPGRVTVLSQGGSRGVDVRSSHRPLLIVLGRAAEPRLDRQFLGRVGRHGEPFDAEFIIDPSSPVRLPVNVLAKLVGDVMPLRGTAARGAAQRQRDMWADRVRRRQQASVLSRAIGEVEAEIAAEFARIRALDGAETMRDFAAGVCSELGDGQEPGSGAEAVLTRVQSALDRRARTDEPVQRFADAMRAAFGESASDQWLPRTVTGEPEEMCALTNWLEAHTSEGGALFRRQAELAGMQRLPALTTPYWRGSPDIVTETRTMANATLLEQVRHRLDSLWVTSTRDSYYRRGAFMVRGLHQLSEQSVRREILANLSVADDPGALDELYYSSEHRISRPSAADDEPAAPDAGPPPEADAFNSERAEFVVAEFLNDRDRAPGGLAVPPDAARLLLLDVLRPLMVGSSVMGATLMRQRVNLLLDSLAAKGIRGGTLRQHRRLIFSFTDALYRQGILTERLTPDPALVGAVRRVRSFVATIPKFGLLAVVGYLGVLAIGVLPVLQPTRQWGFASGAARLFGLGAVLPDRPLLAFFALLVVLLATARACGFSDPAIFTIRVMPILAVVVALTMYNRGWSGIGWTLLFIPALTLWTGMLFTAHRYVLTFIGADANTVVAAASVVVYLVRAPHPQTSAVMVLGLLAATTGPAIPISIAGRHYARGTFMHADDRARVRVALDPTLASALAAVVLVTVIGRAHGVPAAVGFIGAQLAALGLMTARRLSPDKVKGMLATLQVGTPLSDSGLRSYLHRAFGRSMAIAAIVLSGAVAVSALVTAPVPSQFLLQEWAGLVLLTGAWSVANALSVAGAATPLLGPRSEDVTIRARYRELREQLRSWRRMRFAWVWKTLGVVFVVLGVLRWIHDWVGVAEVLRLLHDLVRHVF